jgi:hypothetical protein
VDHRANASPSTPSAPNADTVSPVGCAAAPLDEVELADPELAPVAVAAVATAPVFAVGLVSDAVDVNAPAEICDLTTDM